MNGKKYLGLLKILGWMLGIQLSRIALKSLIFLAVPRTDFSDRMASLASMLILTALFILIAKKRGMELTVFPKRFGAAYIIATVIFAALLISTPIITKDSDSEAILLLVYSAMVTPLFEELIFRGYIWNTLGDIFEKEWQTYLLSAALFALWHFGYADALAFRVKEGLANALMWKAITGLCFGLVLGAVRLKTKNCYSTMLLHGLMNIFGR